MVSGIRIQITDTQLAGGLLDGAVVAAIHPFYTASFREFEAAGRPIVLATTTPFDLVKPLADILGLDEAEFPRMLLTLPVQFDEATKRTIELIDVLWLKGKAIVAAFEVENEGAAIGAGGFPMIPVAHASSYCQYCKYIWNNILSEAAKKKTR